MAIERRHILTPVELRAKDGDDDHPILGGTAAVFNEWSQDLGGFREQIAPGAFKAALQDSDPRALFNHNPDHLLGRRSAGTLRLNETKEALVYEVDPPDTQLWRDVRENIRLGNITGNSFAFAVEADEWVEPKKPGDLHERTITKFAEVFDVGPVTYPAYDQTEVDARCLERVKRHSAAWKDEAAFNRHLLAGLDIRA